MVDARGGVLIPTINMHVTLDSILLALGSVPSTQSDHCTCEMREYAEDESVIFRSFVLRNDEDDICFEERPRRLL